MINPTQGTLQTQIADPKVAARAVKDTVDGSGGNIGPGAAAAALQNIDPLKQQPQKLMKKKMNKKMKKK